MQQFTEKYRDQIVGILSGFDRFVFRGSLRRLNLRSLGPGPGSVSGAWHGGVPLAEQDPVQALRAAREASERALATDLSEALPRAECACDFPAFVPGG